MLVHGVTLPPELVGGHVVSRTHWFARSEEAAHCAHEHGVEAHETDVADDGPIVRLMLETGELDDPAKYDHATGLRR